jgi:phosphopantetheinyl transferase
MLMWRDLALKDISKLEHFKNSAYVFLLESETPNLVRTYSHAVANRILQSCANDSGLRLQKDDKGKPQVPGSIFHISLSHSGRCLAVAVGTVDLGIDIEYLRHRDMWLSLYHWVNEPTDRLVSPTERDFLACWTAKESLVKVLGSGLDYGMHKLSIPAIRSTAYRQVTVENKSYWLKPLPRWKKMVACLAMDELSFVQTYFITVDPGAMLLQ